MGRFYFANTPTPCSLASRSVLGTRNTVGAIKYTHCVDCGCGVLWYTVHIAWLESAHGMPHEPPPDAQTISGHIHIETRARQYGHSSSSCSAHGPALVAARHRDVSFGLVKQMMHVVSPPPRVDSGALGRPASRLALASETTASDSTGGSCSAADEAASATDRRSASSRSAAAARSRRAWSCAAALSAAPAASRSASSRSRALASPLGGQLRLRFCRDDSLLLLQRRGLRCSARRLCRAHSRYMTALRTTILAR